MNSIELYKRWGHANELPGFENLLPDEQKAVHIALKGLTKVLSGQEQKYVLFVKQGSQWVNLDHLKSFMGGQLEVDLGQPTVSEQRLGFLEVVPRLKESSERFGNYVKSRQAFENLLKNFEESNRRQG